MASTRIAIVGCGKIGEALLSGILASGFRKPDELVVTGRRPDRIEALTKLKSLRDDGVLTQEQFDAERQKLLQGM